MGEIIANFRARFLSLSTPWPVGFSACPYHRRMGSSSPRWNFRYGQGSVRLTFGTSGTRLEATLADGQLKGAYGSGGEDMHLFTASKFCSCASEGDAGPDISGTWWAFGERVLTGLR